MYLTTAHFSIDSLPPLYPSIYSEPWAVGIMQSL
jgi:hypothetical protein